MSLFDTIANLGTVAGQLYGLNEGISSAREVGTEAQQRAERFAGDVASQTEFRPFTVTSNVGGVTTTPTGDLTTTLSPQQQAQQAQLQNFTSQAFNILGSPEERATEQANVIGMLTQDPNQRAAREQDIFGRLQATMSPEQERARLQLEERLANQGRLGVRTDMFGGTPEQLALEKAIAEQQAGLGVSAMEQARQEQALQAQQTLAGLGETRARLGLLGDVGLSSLEASYLPQEALLRTLSPAIDLANLASISQRQGAQLGTSLIEAGLESRLQAERTATDLEQQRLQGITNLLLGSRTPTGEADQTGLFTGLLKGIFGG